MITQKTFNINLYFDLITEVNFLLRNLILDLKNNKLDHIDQTILKLKSCQEILNEFFSLEFTSKFFQFIHIIELEKNNLLSIKNILFSIYCEHFYFLFSLSLNDFGLQKYQFSYLDDFYNELNEFLLDLESIHFLLENKSINTFAHEYISNFMNKYKTSKVDYDH